VSTATSEDTGPADKTTVLTEGLLRRDEIDEFILCAMGRSFDCTMKPAIERGLFETGLRPRFPDNANCRDIDEQWAIVYTFKRNREAYHGGIDMPAPWGTPMIAAADGTVIGKALGENRASGIEIVLRHSPQDTGLPVWTFTQYTHFSKMPEHEVGHRIRMGEVLGPTGNSGISTRTGVQSETRRPAIHFAVFFNSSGEYAVVREKIIPAEGRWMDPNAMFRKRLPFDSKSMKALPSEEKQIPISVMFEDGTTYPSDTRIVWPYTCEHR
jgi:murein DD-endopeptidase MepM/ murein hydrolase activator NlpD